MQGKDKLGARSHTCVTRDRAHARARMRILGHTASIRGDVAFSFFKYKHRQARASSSTASFKDTHSHMLEKALTKRKGCNSLWAGVPLL